MVNSSLRRRFLLGAVVLGFFCSWSGGSTVAAAGSSPAILSSSSSDVSEEKIGRQFPALLLKVKATNAKYGVSQEAAVKVGGGFDEGSHRVYGFLNALTGPHGEPVHYTRIGTCCGFKTPNSPFGGEGLLEVYEVTFEGGTQPLRLYFDWYDSEDLLIPVGLSAHE